MVITHKELEQKLRAHYPKNYIKVIYKGYIVEYLNTPDSIILPDDLEDFIEHIMKGNEIQFLPERLDE